MGNLLHWLHLRMPGCTGTKSPSSAIRNKPASLSRLAKYHRNWTLTLYMRISLKPFADIASSLPVLLVESAVLCKSNIYLKPEKISASIEVFLLSYSCSTVEYVLYYGCDSASGVGYVIRAVLTVLVLVLKIIMGTRNMP
jgi:hypothetical protein